MENIERRSNTYWMPKYSKNGTLQTLPKWILKQDSGWMEIKEKEQLVGFFPLHVRQVLGPDMEKFFVYVHQGHEHFAKGVYEKLIIELKAQLSDSQLIVLLFENGIGPKDTYNYYQLKNIITKSLGWEIKEDFVNGKLNIEKKEKEAKTK